MGVNKSFLVYKARSCDLNELCRAKFTVMLLVLSEEHKEHLSFLTKVDVEGK